MVYNVEYLTLLGRERIFKKMLKLKEIKHPNVLKYLHSELNNEKNEITIITELAGNLKNYLKKMSHPKLKVIRNWCFNILNGLEYLFNQDITQVNLSPESIFLIEEHEIKIGDIVIENKFNNNQKLSKKNLEIVDQGKSELLNSDHTKIIYNFGKAVIYMLFHQSQVFKIVLKLLKHPCCENILFDNIHPENLRGFLKV